ncbi:MAG: hypothetical protein QXP35_03085 [Candidatus Micrarchaeaceae archaeon]
MKFNLFGKKNANDLVKNSPYIVATELVPYRLYANKTNSLVLFVRIKNITKDTLLTSLDLTVPSKLGLSENLFSKQKQVKVGEILSNQEKELRIEIFGNIDTDQGEYTLNINANAHFRDYSHIINSVTKSILLKVIK